MLKQFARYLLPYWLKIALKRAYYTFQDILDLLGKKRDPLYPPKRLNFVGSAEFKKIGDEFLGHFKTLGGLKPNDSVLDIGCGVGRMAIPLTHYLKQGNYVGFDIVKRGITWCQKNITPKHPHFRFVHANVKNKFYNAKGTVASEDYTFPAEDKKFDFFIW